MKALIQYFSSENAGKASGGWRRAAQPTTTPGVTLPAGAVGLIPAGGNHPANPVKRILVVDDEPHVAAAIRMVLTHASHQVEIAGDAESALSTFEAGKYDLVITDFSLPQSDGFCLARELRRRCPVQPIIMITAYAEVMALEREQLRDIDFLMGKPFSLDQMKKALAHVFPPQSNAPKACRPDPVTRFPVADGPAEVFRPVSSTMAA